MGLARRGRLAWNGRHLGWYKHGWSSQGWRGPIASAYGWHGWRNPGFRLAGEIEPTLLAVLSDINMPGMDGLTLLGEIRQRFIVTAYRDDERRRQASENGAAEFLTKPVDFDHLKEPTPRIEEAGPVDRMTAYPPSPIDPQVRAKVGFRA